MNLGYPNLKAEMARCNVNALDIAAILNINVNNVYPLLNGRRKLSVARAIKIKTAFFPNCDFEYLFHEDERKVS